MSKKTNPAIASARRAQDALDALADPTNADHDACDKALATACRKVPKSQQDVVDLVSLLLRSEGPQIDSFVRDGLLSIRKWARGQGAIPA